MAFLVVSIVIFNVVAFFMPKRLTPLEIFTTSLFATILQILVDTFLDLKYDLYGYFQKGIDYMSLLVFLGIYPAANCIILNYYPSDKKPTSKILYLLAWCVFLPLFEWACLEAGFFYYNGWKLWYSCLCYPVILLILVSNFAWVRKLAKKPV